MARVDWTPNGEKILAEKEFRYLSAEFDVDYTDNETPDISHGTVLLGAGLTNRPVIKRMDAVITLSENSLQRDKMKTETKEIETTRQINR